MNKTDGNVCLDYSWELVGFHHETKEILKFCCSAQVVEMLFQQIVKNSSNEFFVFPAELRENLQAVVNKGSITLELIHKLTTLDMDWLNSFIQGNALDLKLSPSKCVTLIEILTRLND
ncbi:HTH domain-containing protein [Lysinibacillus sp. NPDC097195]|uniref:HTH domain-containing protein n=1 Tax=Lysinibacillus sp. NPDC097195 TaxID=3364141 RepID=UPI0037F102CE